MFFRIVGKIVSIMEASNSIKVEIRTEDNLLVKLNFIRNDLSCELMNIEPWYKTIVDISGEYDYGLYRIEKLKINNKDISIRPKV